MSGPGPGEPPPHHQDHMAPSRDYHEDGRPGGEGRERPPMLMNHIPPEVESLGMTVEGFDPLSLCQDDNNNCLNIFFMFACS